MAAGSLDPFSRDFGNTNEQTLRVVLADDSPGGGGGGGGGTEYVEAATPPAHPRGGTLVLPRVDTPTTLAAADGDWALPRLNALGAVYVQQNDLVDTSDTVAIGDGTGASAMDTVNHALNVTIVSPATLPVSGSVTATTPPASSITTGAKVTIAAAGTRQQLANLPATRGVLVQAAFANSALANGGFVYVGDVGVTNSSGANPGYFITPTGSYLFPVSNADLLWVDADDTGAVLYVTVI